MGLFDSPPIGSYQLPIDTYGLYFTFFELFTWLQKRFRPSVRPCDPATMTNTALEATSNSKQVGLLGFSGKFVGYVQPDASETFENGLKVQK